MASKANLEALAQLHRETVAQLLRDLPIARRLEGLSAEQILAALSPHVREELAQLLEAEGAPPNPH